MRETIQRVMVAEEEAKRLVDAARMEGAGHLADCRRKAQELVENIEREGRLTGAELLEAAINEAHRERDDRIRTASAEIQATIRLVDAMARDAVDAIVRCVCGRGRS